VVVAVAVVFAAGALCIPVRPSCASVRPDPCQTLLACEGYLESGDRGQAVRALQEALDSLGYGTSADGVFGPETRSSARAFQGDLGLRADGIAGPDTIRALSREYYRRNPPETCVLEPGETLSAISERYGVDVPTLVRINELRDPDLVYAGQVILLQEPPEEDQAGAVAPEPPLPPVLPPLPSRRICLTFDDGPDVYTTRPVLAILDSYGVKATFFLTGQRAARSPDLVREIAASGHLIGIHGYDHKVLAGLPASEIRKDLLKAQDSIASITGERPWLYRPPAGLLDRTGQAEAAKLGLTTLMWTNIGGADLGAGSADEVVARVTEGARDGGVILLHEGLQLTVEALPALIEALARLGFGFQNVSPTGLAREP
jgi:peptidoglycan/xylan/chitin deacetylase (PgdA/CDA1 family)